MMVRVKRQSLSPLRLIKPIGWMCFAVYLGYHTLHGERGVYALIRDNREVIQLTQSLAKTKAEREAMELRVSHLRDNSLDRDLLDEQMRRMLGVMSQGEVIVLMGNGN